MPTALSGLVDDADILAEDLVRNVSDKFTLLDSEFTQFTTMLMKIGSLETDRSKTEWIEDELFPRLSALAASATTAATDLTVTTGEGQYFRVGDVIRNQVTGEAYAVTGVSTDTVGVTRSVGAVAAATSVSGAQLLIVSNASAQGATLGTAKITKRVAGYNYTQIHRSPYSFTRTSADSNQYGGGQLERERRKKAIEHKRGIEYTLFWGARDLNTGGSEPIGYAGGAYEFISTNIHSAGGALSAATFDTYMRTDLQHGNSNAKVLFAAPIVSQALSGFLRDAWQPNTVNEKLWGARVDGFISGAYGFRLPVVTKRDWNDFATTSNQFGSMAFLIDMESCRYRPFVNASTRLLRNRQAPDADRVTEEYLTEFTLEFQQEKHHGLIRGVTG